MMRALALVLLLAGCGSVGVPIGGGSDLAGVGGSGSGGDFAAGPADLGSVCEAIGLELVQIAADNQSCTRDSDCFFVGEISWDHLIQRGCDTFVNAAGLMQIQPLLQKLEAEGCPFSCMALLPHCTNGSCRAP